MKFWTWLKGLFLTTKSPAQVALDYKLEADIVAKRNELARACDKVLITRNAYVMLRERKKKSKPARMAYVQAKAYSVSLEMQLSELEKRRG